METRFSADEAEAMSDALVCITWALYATLRRRGDTHAKAIESAARLVLRGVDWASACAANFAVAERTYETFVARYVEMTTAREDAGIRAEKMIEQMQRESTPQAKRAVSRLLEDIGMGGRDARGVGRDERPEDRR